MILMSSEDKMSEAEVSLRLAFHLLNHDLVTSDVDVAIDGAQIRTLDKLSGPYSQDNKRSSLRWCPAAQLAGAAPILSVVLRSTNLSTILAPPPLAVR